jgi:hypothetical protein
MRRTQRRQEASCKPWEYVYEVLKMFNPTFSVALQYASSRLLLTTSDVHGLLYSGDDPSNLNLSKPVISSPRATRQR